MIIIAVFLMISSGAWTNPAGSLATVGSDQNFASHLPVSGSEPSQTTTVVPVYGMTGKPLTQNLATETYDWKEVCTARNDFDSEGYYCRHEFRRAECDVESGNPRLVKVFCFADCTKVRYRRLRRKTEIVDYPHTCHEGSVCEPIYIPLSGDGGPGEEVACTDLADIRKDTVTDRNKKPGKENLYCGLSLQLPGESSIAPANEPIDIILTEHVLKPDGSPLNVPTLYIRDTTSPKNQFDRVLRHDASVASALVQIEVYRGRLQQRTYEFCMQLPSKAVSSTSVFVYSFIQVQRRHGRSLVQVDRE